MTCCAERGVDILEMHVPDSVGVLRVTATGSAPPTARWPVSTQRPTCGAGEHPVDLVAGLDHRADVRVQGGDHAPLLGPLRQPVEVGEQRLPPEVVEVRASRRSRRRRCAPPARRRPRPDARQASMNASTSGSGSCSRSWSSDREEAADRPQAVLAQLPCALACGSSARKPGGPNSVAARPSARISPSTRSGASW